MNGLDYAILIGAGSFFALGLYWGLIRQTLSLVGLIVGIIAAGRYGPQVADWLSSFLPDPLLAGALGFLVVLLLVSALASLLASLLRLFIGLLFLGWLDHLLGGLLGLLQAVIAAAVLLVIMQAFPQPLWTPLLTESRLAEPLLRVGDLLSGLLPFWVTDFRL
jgi:membrane protein required for colicin V production